MPGLWQQKIDQSLQEYGPKPLLPEVLQWINDREGTLVTLLSCTHILSEISTTDGLKRVIYCHSAEKAKNLLFLLYHFISQLDASSRSCVIKNLLELRDYDAFTQAIHVLINNNLLDAPHGRKNFSYLVQAESLGKMGVVANTLYRYQQELSEKISQNHFEAFKHTHERQVTNTYGYFSSAATENLTSHQDSIKPQC